MRKVTASVLILFFFAGGLLYHFVSIHKNISSSLIRMHIIANSDSAEDQKVKLEIRDKILENYSFAADNAEGEKDYIENNIKSISKDVNMWLKEKGFDYGAKAKLTVDYFPTKKYGGLTLPQGEYTAFKVILGEGKGRNWWCVMFPPLCFADSSVGKLDADAEKYLKNNLSDEEFRIVTGSGVTVRFKILEIINRYL